MKLFKHLLLALAVVLCVEAQAQRMPVPIVDFKDVPVSAPVPNPVTADGWVRRPLAGVSVQLKVAES